MAGSKRYDLFLSFSQRDKSLADAVHTLLKAVGLDVFFSPHPTDGLTAGAQWFPSLLKALDGSRAILVLATPASVSEHWPVFEAGAIAVRQASGLDAPVITALAGVAPDALPRPLQSLQAVDLRKGRGDFLQRLGNALGRQIADSPEAEVAFGEVEKRLQSIEQLTHDFKKAVQGLVPTWRFELSRAVTALVNLLDSEPRAASLSGQEIVDRVRLFDKWVADFDEVAHFLLVNGQWEDAQQQFSKLFTGLARVCHAEPRPEHSTLRGDLDVRRIVSWRIVIRIVRRVRDSGSILQLQVLLKERHTYRDQNGQYNAPLGCVVPPAQRLDVLAAASGPARSPLWAYLDLFEPRETASREEHEQLAAADLVIAFWVASQRLRGGPSGGRWFPFLGGPDVGIGIDGLSRSLRQRGDFARFAEVLEVDPGTLRSNWDELSGVVFGNFSANITWSGDRHWPGAEELPSFPPI